MNAYRTHTCQALTSADVGSTVMLSGWINRKRDHGQLLFVDLRDHYGITQCVADSSDSSFSQVEDTRVESVVRIKGKVVKREEKPSIPICQQVKLKCGLNSLKYYPMRMFFRFR